MKTHKLELDIPAGIDDGQRMKLQGQGELPVNGGIPGDLYVVVNIQPHEIFERRNDNVILDMPIRFSQAALGAQVEVPTLDGPVNLKIPPGTQNGNVFRIRGKGIQHLGGMGRGDQYVKVTVEVPTNLSGSQKDLISQFDDSIKNSSKKSMPMFDSFVEKVKKILSGE